MDKKTLEALRDQLASVSADLDQAQAHLDMAVHRGHVPFEQQVQMQAAIDRRRNFTRRLRMSVDSLTEN